MYVIPGWPYRSKLRFPMLERCSGDPRGHESAKARCKSELWGGRPHPSQILKSYGGPALAKKGQCHYAWVMRPLCAGSTHTWLTQHMIGLSLTIGTPLNYNHKFRWIRIGLSLELATPLNSNHRF